MSAARRRPVAVLTLALLAVGGVLAAIRLSLPSDGTMTAASNPLPDGVEIAVLGDDRGLRAEDEVVAVEGRALAERSLPDAEVGDVLTYTVRRDGRVLDVDVRITDYPARAALGRNWPALTLVLSLLLVAGYVYVRRPDDRSARALLLVGGLLACGSTASLFGLQVIDLDGGAGWWANLAGGVALIFVWPAMLHFALLLPEANPLLRRYPRLPVAVFLLPVVLYAVRVTATFPGADTELQRVGALVPSGTLTELIFPVLTIVAFAVAYRSTTSAGTRTRLRWVAGSFFLAVALYLALWRLPTLLGGDALVSSPLHLLLFLPCPVAIGIAVLRVNLFDIDVVVRRSLAYATLTAVVVAIYAATVGLLSSVVQTGNEWVALVATGLVAVLILPLHQRLQRVVTRLLYGERDDPYAIVSRFGERLEATPGPTEILPQLVATVAESLRLPYASIELIRDDGDDVVTTYGQRQGAELELPLAYQGQRLGRLVVGERTPGEGFGNRDRRVLTSLARQIGVAVQSVRLTVDLQRSRERLVAAREEERRRLRRDLHDGLGPALAATALQLQTARRLLRRDPDGAESILTGLSDHTQSAIRDIRRLVDDLRPASLDQLGLVGAVQEQASRFSTGGAANGAQDTLNVSVETSGDLQSLPAAVEVAAFRIVCEALNNAYRHGHAETCMIRIRRDEALEIEVVDDGRGFASPRADGVGLGSMRERATELGGSFSVESGEERGTAVRATLPLRF